MNDMQKGVIALIKSAIAEEPQPLPEGFSIDEAYDFIMKHKIMMLAYDGAVRCGIQKDDPAMQKLFQSYIKGMLHSEKQMKAVNEIYSAFDENGIDYLPLKGCNMKYLYPKPELRLMGDADILIKEEQYKKIRKVLVSLGMKEDRESMHHYLWYNDNMLFELHTMPMPENYKKFSDYYKNGWSRAHKTETNKYVYSQEDNFIFILTHFAKHFLEGGVGLRHVTDIVVYLNEFQEMNYKYIENELEKIGIIKFYKNLMRMIENVFENKSCDETTNVILDYIFESGNWGSFTSHVFAIGAKYEEDDDIKSSKLKFFLKAAFPPVENLKSRYKILKKHSWILPLVWPIRWIDALIFRRKNVFENLKQFEIMDDSEAKKTRENFKKAGFDI